MEYIIISDDNGTVAAFRQRQGKQLTVARAFVNLVRIYPVEAPNIHEIFGPTDTAPKGGKRVTVYLSQNASGKGRIGRNWVDFVVRKVPA